MSLSVVAALLAFTVQRRASLQSLGPACKVTKKPDALFIFLIIPLHMKVYLFKHVIDMFFQDFIVTKDPTLLLQCQVRLEVFVQPVTTVQRAVAYPLLAQLAHSKTRLEEEVKRTVNHVLLVNMKLCYMYLNLYCTNSLNLFEDVLTDSTFLPGWFQKLSGQRWCNPCPPGFQCQSLGPSPLLCPAGYVCPIEGPHSEPFPCPRGTYGPSQGLTTTGESP